MFKTSADGEHIGDDYFLGSNDKVDPYILTLFDFFCPASDPLLPRTFLPLVSYRNLPRETRRSRRTLDQ